MANEDELTSAELDGLLGETETLSVEPMDRPTEMQLYVAVDADTWRELQRRAALAGSGVADAAAEALRAGTHVA